MNFILKIFYRSLVAFKKAFTVIYDGRVEPQISVSVYSYASRSTENVL